MISFVSMELRELVLSCELNYTQERGQEIT